MSKPVVTPIDLPWRSVPEWVGKTPDTPVPVTVKNRVFARYEGRCHLTGRKILVGDDWDVEHIKPVRGASPGEPHRNRESNLAPALRDPHREKTAQENSDGKTADRLWAKHNGVWKGSGRKIAAHIDPWGKNRRQSTRPQPEEK